MNVWKITGAGNLSRLEAPIPSAEGGRLRVRIKNVFLGGVDAALYGGKLKTRYPIIPGRFAVGIIADETVNPRFPKGSRVLLHTFRPEPYTGTAKRDFSEDDYGVCGQTRDGFLQDFVLASPDEMTPLPDFVSDERALVSHFVALGREAIEKLDVQRGQHIAVVGADLYGILICQLLIYQQAAPILIDADPKRLAFAKSCGVYYTLTADDDLLDGVANITGGRLASGAIMVTSAEGNDLNVPFLVSARDTNTVICGLIPEGVSHNLDLALRKQISLHCLWLCDVNLETAFNLIATHAVDTSAFQAHFIHPDNIANFFKEYSEHPERDVKEVNFVNLL